MQYVPPEEALNVPKIRSVYAKSAVELKRDTEHVTGFLDWYRLIHRSKSL